MSETYEQLPLPIEIAEPEFDDDGDGGEHSGAPARPEDDAEEG